MSPALLSGFDVSPGFPLEKVTTTGSSEDFLQDAVLAGATSQDHVNHHASFLSPPLASSRNGDIQLEMQGPSVSNPKADLQRQTDAVVPTPENAPRAPSASGVITRELAQLSISLDEHAALISPLSIHRLNPEQRPKCPQFSLDRTFHLTQSLIELYPQFIQSFVRGDSSPSPRSLSSNLPASEPSLPQPPNGSNPETSNSASSSSLKLVPKLISQPNQASILLILSVHHRLIDMWELIFGHIHAMPAHDFGKHCLKFQIGSFVPSMSSSAVPMEIIMVVELARQLLVGLGELVGEMMGEGGGWRESGSEGEGRRLRGDDDRGSEREGGLAPSESGSSNGAGVHAAQKIGKRNAERACDSGENPTVMASKVVLNRARRMVDEIGRIRDMMQERRREPMKAAVQVMEVE